MNPNTPIEERDRDVMTEPSPSAGYRTVYRALEVSL
jgi:hypothetical protein